MTKISEAPRGWRTTMDGMAETLAGTDRHLLDAAPEAMVVVDEDGTIVMVNRQTEALFGYARNQLIGAQVEVLLPNEFRSAHPAHRDAFVAEPRFRAMGDRMELYGQRSDGTSFPVEISLSAVEADGGRLFASAIRDITARKQVERELTSARELAETATRAKSRFLAAASHDLRQPLQSLGLYLTFLSNRINEPALVDVCRKMQQSLDTVRKLLDALLDISKLDGGAIVPHKTDVRLNVLLDRVMNDNLQQARTKGLELGVTASDCIVHTDEALLERVIENFVTNAIRYTQEGRVSITCDSVDGAARISVSDTGIGIPEAQLDRIFDEYYQLDHSRDISKGLGLGLAIVKHIAQLLDHPLSVSSVLGKGSTFTVQVPLGTRPVEPMKMGRRDMSVRTRSVVLFVDDDPGIVEGMKMVLEGSNVEVHTALDGEAALAHIEAGVRPDLIVCDYRLPGCNGVELIARIRETTGRTTPSVIMTGDTSGDEIEAATLLDCTVLHKPADTGRLLDIIEGMR